MTGYDITFLFSFCAAVIASLNLASAAGAPTVIRNCFQLGSRQVNFQYNGIQEEYIPRFLIISSGEVMASICAVHEATHLNIYLIKIQEGF